MNGVTDRLLARRDPKFGDFFAGLAPTVDKARIIGVRAPEIRSLAKELKGTAEAADFMAALPHAYCEEDMLHAALIAYIRDYAGCVAAVEAFLPYVDNWAVCDTLNPSALKKNKADLLTHVQAWLQSEREYTVRFGLGTLMRHFLDADFDPQYLDWAATLEREEYYIKMMAAWYFATALAKQYDAALPYIRDGRLDRWTHNKTIQKAVESFRVTPEHKDILRTLRR